MPHYQMPPPALPGVGYQEAGLGDSLQQFLTGEVGIPVAPQVQTACGPRTPNTLLFVNPRTGQPVFYKNRGKPILFSGDLQACKMVNRVARRARRASPRGRAVARRRVTHRVARR